MLFLCYSLGCIGGMLALPNPDDGYLAKYCHIYFYCALHEPLNTYISEVKVYDV